MNTYEEKKQAKIDRYRELAAKKANESNARCEESRRLGSILPFGQPILVGHHSEGKHRRLIAKIGSNMDKSIELQDTANYYEQKAISAENNTAISSDDPEAIVKLKAKIEKLESDRDKMKAMNKAYKAYETKQDTKPLIALGYPEEKIKALHVKIQDGYSWCRQPYPSYTLTNLGATIRNTKDRLEKLEKVKDIPNSELTINNIRILMNMEANRIQVFFPCKPDYNTISELKHGGFRWSPTNGAWQAYRKQRPLDIAKRIATNYIKDNKPC